MCVSDNFRDVSRKSVRGGDGVREAPAPVLVHAFVGVPEPASTWRFKYFANAEERGHGDGPTGPHLLPVAGGEAERLVSPEETCTS
jgi:hypothetical protein